MENQIFEEVPNIITGKDLDYISDMFNWNYIALKKVNVALEEVEDEELVEILEKAYHLFDNNLNVALSILKEGSSNE